MAKTPDSRLRDLLSITKMALQATTQEQFIEGLRAGFSNIHGLLTSDPEPEKLLRLLDTALGQSGVSPREKRVLEVCAWPVFDKPALPIAPGARPEFLWIFCVPVVLQFASCDLEYPIQFGKNSFDSQALTDALNASGYLNPKGILSMLPSLYTADDLQRQGPANLATQFVRQELGMCPADLEPSGVQLDPDLEAARFVTYYALACLRLPVGERFLQSGTKAWDAQPFTTIVSKGLSEQGYTVESLQTLTPCSVAETLLNSTPAATIAMRSLLSLSKETYGLMAVSMEYPALGWVELHGHVSPDQPALLLSPAFTYIEPAGELERYIASCCDAEGLMFEGAFSLVGPTSSMLQ